jgi:signal peptidase I
MTTPRRPWVAFILSLLMPGLGQFYCGRWMAAALFYLPLFVLAFLHRAAVNLEWPAQGLVIIGGGVLLLMLAAAFEAATSARHLARYEATTFNRWYFYAPAILWNLVLVFAIACLNNYRIPSAAMTPTIVVGDQILTSSYIPLAGGPGRCDIAVFVEEVDGKEVAFIKRIVGLAGDTVAYQNGRLVINGTTANRDQVSQDDAGVIYRETLPGGCSYLIREQSDNGLLDNTPEYKVPSGTVFMLGDNRDDSMDSRTEMIGFVPVERFRGRALLIYWANDPSRVGRVD